MNKYSIDKNKVGKFILYTIWDNENQIIVKDFNSQDYGSSKIARLKAEDELKRINHTQEIERRNK